MLIADPRPIAASGLTAAFQKTDEFAVQSSCHEAAGLASVLGADGSIDAVIVDGEMFDGDASGAVAAIRRLDPSVAVLLLAGRVDEPLLEALAHERVSCVSAYSQAQAIVSALRALMADQTLLPPEVQRALTDRLRRPPSPPPPMLTMREEQVLELAATGLTIAQIAGRLYISHSTAKTHLLHVYEKLGAPNRSAAIATAVARGVLRPSAAAA
ncbi:MAG TPA: response regulator transcription factor [Solirubrobacteraceae bacterium]|nr:response regulator transcription factor [Solirubrobacteraceae bacterium]